MYAHLRWSMVVGAWALVAARAPQVHAVDWQLLSESADGLRLRVEVRIPPPMRAEVQLDGLRFARFDVPDTRPIGSPGAPLLAEATQWLGLPRGGTATVRVVESDIRDMGSVLLLPRAIQSVRYPEGASPDDPSSGLPSVELVYDAQRYVADGARGTPVRLGAVGHLRHQQIVPLLVSPLLYDPSTQRLRIVRRLLLEVVIRTGPRMLGAGSDAAIARAVTPRSWERIYAATLLNATSAQRWQFTPEPVQRIGAPLKSGLLRPGLLGEDEWKLRVRSTGPVRVRARTLRSAGFPDGEPIERLRLVLKRFNPAQPLDATIVEIPILVEDVDADGMFRDGDAFVFVAEHPRDDDTAGERAARYSFDNVYWLSLADAGTPARMPVRPPLAGAAPGPQRFDKELVLEEDKYLNQWVYCDEGELYFTMDRSTSVATKTLTTPGRASDMDLRVCVETQQDWLRRPYRLLVRLQSGRSILLGASNGRSPNVPRGVCPQRIELCGTVPAAQVEPGLVTVVLTPEDTDEHDFPNTTPFVDLIRLEYVSDYTANGNVVECTSAGAEGPTAFTMSGFTAAPLLALDITDRKAPASFDLSGALSGGTLTLTDDVPSGTLRRYLVLASSGVPALGIDDIELDAPDPILDELRPPSLGRYDVVVVAHDDFADDAALMEWKSFRESQGHRVRIIATSDVYDAFNGGLLHYDPIYNFVRTAYDNWGISYLMVVGDGSEDAAGLNPASGPNFVPSKMVYFPVIASGGGGGSEYRNDMNERHYGKMNGDAWPDLLVGRLPVSNTQELRNVIDKILLYENPPSDDDSSWRKRVVMFSDDEWVVRPATDGGGGFRHQRGCQEWNFFWSIQRACETVDQAFPGDLRCVPFYLHTFSDSLATSVPEHTPVPDSLVPSVCLDSSYASPHRRARAETNYYIFDVSAALADTVGEGALFLALQSHAARSVVADERIIYQRMPFEPLYHNDGKPFVFFGLGCHLNEFGVVGEDATPYGDALGEMFVTYPRSAAVASYASTGFEYLHENNRFHENMWRTIFNKLYFRGVGGGSVNSDTLESNWTLSALTQISEISHGSPDLVDRYSLLGDPLLQLDAGVPRFEVAEPQNGILYQDGRVRPIDPAQPVRFSITINDEQGIDSLWVEQRFAAGNVEPVPDVFITANIDTAAQIVAKRSFNVDFSVLFTECNFDLHVGARDVAGRISEWVGSASFPQVGRLLANGVPVQDRDNVEAVVAFRYEYDACAPRPDLQLSVFLDGHRIEPTEIGADEHGIQWFMDFGWDVGTGRHTLQFHADGREALRIDLIVPGQLGLSNVLAFPNPFAGATRIFFNLDSQIAGGMLRILDLNGRMVRHFDLAHPGVVQVLGTAPPGGIGSIQDMNYVEWDGTDGVGDPVANGVYLYELRVEDVTGHALRKLDKLVVMN